MRKIMNIKGVPVGVSESNKKCYWNWMKCDPCYKVAKKCGMSCFNWEFYLADYLSDDIFKVQKVRPTFFLLFRVNYKMKHIEDRTVCGKKPIILGDLESSCSTQQCIR